jgi:hypothetical protein
LIDLNLSISASITRSICIRGAFAIIRRAKHEIDNETRSNRIAKWVLKDIQWRHKQWWFDVVVFEVTACVGNFAAPP